MARKKLTEAQKQELKDKDNALRERAAEAEQDAEFMGKLADALNNVDPESSFAKMSSTNKILFFMQCMDMGIVPTGHTHTLFGWRNHGRKVRKGSKGIRIIRPRTKDEQTYAAEVEHAKKTGGAEPSKFAGGFMGSTFDMAQTDPADEQPSQEESAE